MSQVPPYVGLTIERRDRFGSVHQSPLGRKVYCPSSPCVSTQANSGTRSLEPSSRDCHSSCFSSLSAGDKSYIPLIHMGRTAVGATATAMIRLRNTGIIPATARCESGPSDCVFLDVPSSVSLAAGESKSFTVSLQFFFHACHRKEGEEEEEKSMRSLLRRLGFSSSFQQRLYSSCIRRHLLEPRGVFRVLRPATSGRCVRVLYHSACLFSLSFSPLFDLYVPFVPLHDDSPATSW